MHKLTVIFGISIVTLLASCAKQPDWSPAAGDIMTRWEEKVNHNKVLPEYPRPQMVRKEWKNLNGLWNYAIRSKEEGQPDLFGQKILVPFPIESAMSGIKKHVVEIEVNGLMTYDRAAIKMDPERVRLINQGYLVPEIILSVFFH